MSNKTIGGQAKELVLLFYGKNELKFTNKDIMVSIKNAKRLLEAGYTYDEIKDTIEYCADNPPPKGIYSFGFITHEINKVTTILKSKRKVEAREKAIDSSSFSNYGIQNVRNKNKLKPQKDNGNFNIFD